MSHDRGGREQAESATNGHLNPSPKTDTRSMAGPSVGKARQNPGDISVESTQNFEMASTAADIMARPGYKNASPRSSSETTSEGSIPRENTALLEPPVTKKTLSELDVNKIVHNPKLRHDINFDPDLHFRPNLDGEKGRRKTEKMEGFYEIMRKQLTEYFIDREKFERELGDTEWCLPVILKAIRGILETLVPQRDRQSVEETFNVELLMQQIRRNVADLPKLAQWLSKLLKCHCAPMRDEWVDEMVVQISKGDQEGDIPRLVWGMRNLLGVLEAMKLDVANHQIRCLRPLLIEDTVHFEQKFFFKKIASRRVDVVGAHAWFKRASSLAEVGQPLQSRGNFWDFIKALVNLTLQSKSNEVVPHTFLFDEERLIKLRTDTEDLINLELGQHMFRGLESNSKMLEVRSIAPDDTPVISAPSSRPSSPANIPSSPLLLPQPHHFAQKTKERGHFRREPSGQQVWVLKIEEDIITCSPRSSPSSTASTPGSCPPTPLYLSLPTVDTSSQLRSSLQAILASSSASDKWKVLGPALALEILRSTTTPLTHLPQFESYLASHLSNTSSRLYQEAEKRVLAQLFPVLEKIIESYTPMSSLQLFEAATVTKAVTASYGVKEEIEDVATRIAHIGVLHWRVWAGLAYLVDPEAEMDEETLSSKP